MTQGYSLRVRDTNAAADTRKIGVRLGRACIAHDVPVTVVAQRMGVTRATVYNWFCGVSTPQNNISVLIDSYIASLGDAPA
jgi:transcriptional regulator with XRE-family HTH domain